MNNNEIIRIRNWRKNIPPVFKEAYRKLYDKAVQKKSMRAAVNSKCLDCMCWQQAEVKRCEIITCPLWQYKPYHVKAAARQESKGSQNI